MTLGIVGTGLAGVRMAAELRERGFSGRIIAWDEEAREPYDRPPLSKELFGEYLHSLAEDNLGNLADLDVTVLPHRVTACLPRAAHWEVSSHAGVASVDYLVIASGAAPMATIPGAHVLYSARDAETLRAVLPSSARVHIVGAGWIGTEIASAAADTGAEVALWEASPHILDRTFHGSVDHLWERWFSQAGIGLHTSCQYPGGLHPDVLIQATGARPTIDFLSGLTQPVLALSNRGALLTDTTGHVLAASGGVAPGLYAVGDCADVVLPDSTVREGGHWTGVLGSAARAAAAITATEPPAFLEAPEVFSTQFGHEIALVGSVPSGGEPAHEAPGGTVLRWDDGGDLRALLAIDAPREVSRARRTLRTPLT